jgi:hypothetical protein
LKSLLNAQKMAPQSPQIIRVESEADKKELTNLRARIMEQNKLISILRETVATVSNLSINLIVSQFRSHFFFFPQPSAPRTSSHRSP